MLVSLLVAFVAIAAPAMAVNADCCAPGAACCGGPCCD